jgi:glycosyltransferase involved in cell wall biosynthesis
MKKILLCITNYHKEEYLERAIRSCLTQIPNGIIIKTVVVNDGSKKFNEKKISKEFPEVKIINYKKNKGVSYASNQALFSTASDYFMRVDADDYISMKSSLITSSILNDNPKIPFVYGNILLINKDFNIKNISRNKRNLLLENGAGIMFRSQYLKSIGGFNTKIRNCEDFDLIIRIEKKYGKGFFVPIAYYKYYKQGTEHLSNSENRKYYLKKLKIKYAKYL